MNRRYRPNSASIDHVTELTSKAIRMAELYTSDDFSQNITPINKKRPLSSCKNKNVSKNQPQRPHTSNSQSKNTSFPFHSVKHKQLASKQIATFSNYPFQARLRPSTSSSIRPSTSSSIRPSTSSSIRPSTSSSIRPSTSSSIRPSTASSNSSHISHMYSSKERNSIINNDTFNFDSITYALDNINMSQKERIQVVLNDMLSSIPYSSQISSLDQPFEKYLENINSIPNVKYDDIYQEYSAYLIALDSIIDIANISNSSIFRILFNRIKTLLPIVLKTKDDQLVLKMKANNDRIEALFQKKDEITLTKKREWDRERQKYERTIHDLASTCELKEEYKDEYQKFLNRRKSSSFNKSTALEFIQNELSVARKQLNNKEKSLQYAKQEIRYLKTELNIIQNQFQEAQHNVKIATHSLAEVKDRCNKEVLELQTRFKEDVDTNLRPQTAPVDMNREVYREKNITNDDIYGINQQLVVSHFEETKLPKSDPFIGYISNKVNNGARFYTILGCVPNVSDKTENAFWNKVCHLGVEKSFTKNDFASNFIWNIFFNKINWDMAGKFFEKQQLPVPEFVYQYILLQEGGDRNRCEINAWVILRIIHRCSIENPNEPLYTFFLKFLEEEYKHDILELFLATIYACYHSNVGVSYPLPNNSKCPYICTLKTRWINSNFFGFFGSISVQSINHEVRTNSIKVTEHDLDDFLSIESSQIPSKSISKFRKISLSKYLNLIINQYISFKHSVEKQIKEKFLEITSGLEALPLTLTLFNELITSLVPNCHLDSRYRRIMYIKCLLGDRLNFENRKAQVIFNKKQFSLISQYKSNVRKQIIEIEQQDKQSAKKILKKLRNSLTISNDELSQNTFFNFQDFKNLLEQYKMFDHHFFERAYTICQELVDEENTLALSKSINQTWKNLQPLLQTLINTLQKNDSNILSSSLESHGLAYSKNKNKPTAPSFSKSDVKNINLRLGPITCESNLIENLIFYQNAIKEELQKNTSHFRYLTSLLKSLIQLIDSFLFQKLEGHFSIYNSQLTSDFSANIDNIKNKMNVLGYI